MRKYSLCLGVSTFPDPAVKPRDDYVLGYGSPHHTITQVWFLQLWSSFPWREVGRGGCLFAFFCGALRVFAACFFYEDDFASHPCCDRGCEDYLFLILY